MTINGVELEFDAFDLDQNETIEKHLTPIENIKEEDFKGMSNAQVIRTFCQKVFAFFNQVFGEGTDKKLFGNKTNMKICLEAILQFREQYNKQINDLTKLIPAKNRQRRSK